MDDIVVSIKDVSKVYKLYDKPIDRLKESLSITHKSYHQDHFALEGISLDVHKGECVGIIGTNGSGKSTLLKIITGVLSPTTGSVTVNGKISALLELGAGFNMEYTGIENIYLNGTMLGFSREEMTAKLDDIINFAEIGDFINQPCKTYSSGMFARLAFAVAINVEPDILIVDEALSVGDIFFQSKCYRKFNEFKEAGKTIIFVTHDMGSVIKYCERSMLIHHGHHVLTGTSAEAVDVYKKILANQYDDSAKDEEQEETTEVETQETETKEKQEAKGWKSKLTLNSNLDSYGSLDAEIVDVVVAGSRCRGIEKENSDLDVVVEYIGSTREDDLFNLLHEDSIYIAGIQVDINPITEGKTGTLETYLPEVETYLQEKAQQEQINNQLVTQGREVVQEQNALASEEKVLSELEKEPMVEPETVHITFTVAECGEFHNMGEYHEGIETMSPSISPDATRRNNSSP